MLYPERDSSRANFLCKTIFFLIPNGIKLKLIRHRTLKAFTEDLHMIGYLFTRALPTLYQVAAFRNYFPSMVIMKIAFCQHSIM
jgi:hypothetical protein